MSYRYSTYYRARTRPKFYGGVRKTRRSIFSRVGYKGRTRLARVPKIQSLPGMELKTVTISIAGPTATIAAASGTVSNQNLSTGFLICNLVQQGNSINSRDGNIITGRHLGLRFSVQAGANTELSDSQVRWMVILDKSPNQFNTTVGNVLQDADEVGSSTTSFNSGLNPILPQRFMIMRQGCVTVSKISGPSPLQFVSVSCPLYGLQTGYTGTANPMTYAYIQANALYFIAFGRMTGAGTLPTISNFLCRYMYSEK